VKGVPYPAAANWCNPPENYFIRKNEAHVWRVGLDCPAAQLERFERLLTQDERQRAERYRFAQDYWRFIARRGCLRWQLGRYLGISPAAIRFSYNAYGKPSLAAGSASSEIFFNLSHSAGVALFGFTRSGEVGIDIEKIRLDFDYQAIGERFFSPGERAALASLPAEDRPAAFFACWTRKEAFIKAEGKGLSIPLAEFEVTLKPGQPARLLAGGSEQTVAHWNLHHLDPAPGYIGAVCFPSHADNLICYALESSLATSLE
jgi:4'-phosphopantetheinyl transferase